MDKKYTADEVFEIVQQNMDNAERWKLLNEMYDMYFNKGNHPKAEIDENY